MENMRLISVNQFCEHYKIPIAFVEALQEYELIEIVDASGNSFLKTTQLNKVEKMIRLHYDLDINMEGIDAIYHLLQQVESLQEEIVRLKNRLDFFENI